MANKYANLVGTNKIKDEYTKINTGFDGVETDIDALNDLVDALDSRVDTIITTPIDGEAAAQEIVAARVSAVKSKTFATLDARFEETEQDVESHMADNVNDADGAHGLKIESGTFTPTLEGDSGTSNHTYSQQVGHYYKIGSLVWFTANIALSAKDANMGGNVKFSGLPFIVSQATSGIISEYGNIATGGKELVVNLRVGVNFGRLQLSGDNVPFLMLPASALANDSHITISGGYKI